jgi:hypothetical protein
MGIVPVVTVFEQTGFDARLEWGLEGARVLAGACRVVVVVDVLSFTTAIEVAVGRGAVVFPHRWPDPGAAAFARRVGAVLAGRRDEPRSTGAPPWGSPDPSGRSTGAPLRGSPDPSGGLAGLPGLLSVRFPGRRAEDLLLLLDRQGVACSAGSACASGAVTPSHVLLAMGRGSAEARETVRFSLGHASTEADVDAAVAAVRGALEVLAPQEAAT